MKTVVPRLTYPELRLMPDDGKRYELINGEVFVTPSPCEKHQRVLGRLFVRLSNHVEALKSGSVYVAPFDVVFSDKTALQPDILYVSAARKGIIGPEYVLGAPDLVVEILSPHRPRFDRVTKLEQYALYGVQEYWIIDPLADSVEVYRLGDTGYDLKATLATGQSLASPLFKGWSLPIADLFAE